MIVWSVRQIFALLLAVLVATGLSLSVTEAGNAPMKMSMGSAMTASGHEHCHDCNGDAGKAKAVTCAPVCAASTFATLPQVAPVAVTEIVTTLAPPEDEFLVGVRSPPDPYPPRSADIG
jgi:hypothetical protein